jgi:hypothetical protein
MIILLFSTEYKIEIKIEKFIDFLSSKDEKKKRKEKEKDKRRRVKGLIFQRIIWF